MTQDPDRIVAERKLQHIRAIEADPDVERGGSGFDSIRLTHRALPELNRASVTGACSFMGKPLSFPLLISSMTGGTGADIARININLAQAAEACGIAMAVGSQRVMFTDPQARASFDLRPYAPTVPLLANLGAVQLNEGMTVDHCRAAVDVLSADGLYLHLNPLQEAVQPEGDRDFSNLSQKIADVVHGLDVPVLFKEVGSGLSPQDVAAGLAAGVRHFDVAGRGGTSWSRIEYHRRTDAQDDLGLVFQDWGLTTVEALTGLRGMVSQAPDMTVIASGGIRSGIDMAKALILGADICGMAAPFLAAAQDSTEAVIAQIKRTQREFETAMFLLGCGDYLSLKGNLSLIRD